MESSKFQPSCNIVLFHFLARQSCKVDIVVYLRFLTLLFYVGYLQSNQPHTFVVVTLDPPIRKGMTLYPHIILQVINFDPHIILSIFCMHNIFAGLRLHYLPLLCVCFRQCSQFETDTVIESTLSMGEELLATKYKDKLQTTYKVSYTIAYVIQPYYFNFVFRPVYDLFVIVQSTLIICKYATVAEVQLVLIMYLVHITRMVMEH